MERQLLFLINTQWTHHVLDRVLGILSCMEFWIPFFVLGAVALVWRHRIRGACCIVFCAIAVLCNEEVISQPLKRWTAKARPHQAMEGVRRVDMAPIRPRVLGVFAPMQISFSHAPNPQDTNLRSFPSSHTLNATTLGVVFSLFFRTQIWMLLPLLMAWSRVYTGAHWPSDVAASILIGLLINTLLLALAEWVWTRHVARLRPSWVSQHPRILLPFDWPKRVPRTTTRT